MLKILETRAGNKSDNFNPATAKLLPLAAMMMAASMGASAQQPKSEVVLPEVKVTGQAENDTYLASKTRVGKVVQDPHDVPQAVTTVTRKIMEEQQVGTFKDALRNVSGLTFNAAEGGRSGDNMMLRGFYTFGDLYLDGIRDTAQYNRETFNLEQIDVLRGAGAMLFGRGQAGGVINQVTKTPLMFDQNKVSVSVGTQGYQEVKGDFNKRINEGTALRINVMNRDEGSTRKNPANGDQVGLHRQGVAFSLALNQDSNDRFWINYSYVKTRDVPDLGIRMLNARPTTERSPNDFYGTNRNFDDSDTQMTTFIHERRIDTDSQIRTQLRVAEYNRSFWAKTPQTPSAPDALSAAGGNQSRMSNYETITLQSDYNTKFKVAGMQHEFLAGMEYLKENSDRQNLRNFGSTTIANPPVYLPYVGGGGQVNKFTSDSYAAYVQDTVEFVPKWKATLGVRRDIMNANYSSSTSPRLNYGQNSTRSALSYHPEEDTHYYLSRSSSFSPTADLYQLSTTPLPPERSNVIELGAKWLFMEGDLALRAALYRAEKSWERNIDLESTATVLTQKRRTDGIEFEVAGRLTDRWEVFSGLALMDGVILKADDPTSAGYEGKRPRNTPSYTFNLWTTYSVTPEWKVGGGVEAKGKRSGYSPTGVTSSTFVFNPNTNPAYERFDAMIAYEQPKWTARLNIKNIFDKVYYDAIYDNGGFTIPGLRRQAILTTEFKF